MLIALKIWILLNMAYIAISIGKSTESPSDQAE